MSEIPVLPWERHSRSYREGPEQILEPTSKIKPAFFSREDREQRKAREAGGILPLTKSTGGRLGNLYVGVSQPKYGVWGIPGGDDGPYRDSCGGWAAYGCLNVEGHRQGRLDQDVVAKVYIDIHRVSCVRASCPVCYESWAGKEANKIEWRIQNSLWLGKPVHVVVSVPIRDYGLVLDDYSKLRARVYKIAKKVGILGGAVIFHPFRQDEKDLSKGWYLSPHFHLICFGWIRRTAEIFEESGYVVKNLGLRESVIATALYQLSHCGIHPKYHAVTWFGRCSYNKLRVKPKPIEERKCPVCDKELRPVFWDSDEPNPMIDFMNGGYFVEAENWKYIVRFRYGFDDYG